MTKIPQRTGFFSESGGRVFCLIEIVLYSGEVEAQWALYEN
jgi:hypothetical protein